MAGNKWKWIEMAGNKWKLIEKGVNKFGQVGFLLLNMKIEYNT